MQVDFEIHADGTREYTAGGTQLGCARYDLEQGRFHLHHVTFANVFTWAVDGNKDGVITAQTLAMIDLIMQGMAIELVSLGML